MPYNFVPLGGTQVQTDLRTIGAFSGTATNVLSTSNTPYIGGRALNVHSAGTAGTAVPGSTADYFCYQVSSKTSAQLYAQGGWGCYWRAMTWINGSVANNVTWDGTNYWLPCTSAVTGNWIGKSADGRGWNFIQMIGAQSGSTIAGPGVALNGVFGWAEAVGATTIFRYTSGASVLSTQLATAGYGVSGTASSGTRAAMCGGTGRIWTTTDLSGPWTTHVVGSGRWTGVVNIPGTQTWIICGLGGTVCRSTDDLATTPVASTVGTLGFNNIAASASAVIIGGGSGTTTAAYRSSDAGATWNPVTFPVAMGNIGGVTYGNGKFVVASFTSTTLCISDDDGVTWTTSVSPFPSLGGYVNAVTGGSYDGLRFFNGRFWLCVTGATAGVTQNNYLLASSVDGKTWELHVSVPPGVTSGSATASCQGVFAADNVNGVPTNANTSVGFGLNTFPPIAPTHYPTWVVNNVVVGTGAPTQPLGMNQWHEYQIFGRPAATANEWAITFVVDGVAYGPFNTTTFAAKASMPLWFMLGRGNFFTITSDIVFYDFPLAQDPGVLGPDLRVYYDQPVTDLTTEWNPSVEGQSNASMVATTSITNATTYVTESGAPQSDTYNMAPTVVPSSHSVLSTKNTAYFSKMIDGVAVVSVGTQMNGENFDGTSTLVSSPVNSWTYVTQDQPVNPDTGAPWTIASLNQEKLRINRVTSASGGDPNWFNVGAMLHFDGADGQTSTIDSSTKNRTVTFFNGSALSTTQIKFGTASLGVNIPSNLTQYVEFPKDTFGTAPFTIEGWFYASNLDSEMYMFQSSANSSTSGNASFSLGVNDAGSLLLRQHITPAIAWTSVAGTIGLNQWYHVAIARDSNGTCRGFVNGVQVGTNSFGNDFNRVENFRLGGSAVFISCWRGYIDEFRITNGLARYTANFTPPTAPFPDHY